MHYLSFYGPNSNLHCFHRCFSPLPSFFLFSPCVVSFKYLSVFILLYCIYMRGFEKYLYFEGQNLEEFERNRKVYSYNLRVRGMMLVWYNSMACSVCHEITLDYVYIRESKLYHTNGHKWIQLALRF